MTKRMTAGEAMAEAVSDDTHRVFLPARYIIERLASLGYVLLPIEPDDAAIEAAMDALPLYEVEVIGVYRALVAHVRKG